MPSRATAHFPGLWADLRSAQQSITVQVYYGQAGQVGTTLREILVERAAAGVRVFMLYDAFGFQRIPPDERAALLKAGVVVVPFRPLRLSTLDLAQNRLHVRGIVIDGQIGWTGGFSIDDRWLGDGRTDGSWRETNVRFRGPAVRQLQAAFAAAWAEATGTLFSGRATVADDANDGAVAGLLYATPTLGTTAAERFLAMSIAGARETLCITNSCLGSSVTSSPGPPTSSPLRRLPREGSQCLVSADMHYPLEPPRATPP